MMLRCCNAGTRCEFKLVSAVDSGTSIGDEACVVFVWLGALEDAVVVASAAVLTTADAAAAAVVSATLSDLGPNG